MERLSSLMVKYNIGADTLFNFLLNNNYEGKLSRTTKVDSHICSLVEKEFYLDNQDKLRLNEVKLRETKEEKSYNQIKSIQRKQTKRIPVSSGQRITYEDIFGACFGGCKEVNCIDPYIREPHQFENVKQLISLIKAYSSNHISFNIITCFDKRNPSSIEVIENEFKKLKETFEYYLDENGNYLRDSFDFHYSVEEDRNYHDRHIYIDDRYIVDMTRGLDIFANFYNPLNFITKNCTIFITRLK